MDTCHYSFVQIHRLYTKTEPCKLWTLGSDDVLLINVGSSVVTNAQLMGMLIMGKAVHVWVQGCMGNLYIFLSILL